MEPTFFGLCDIFKLCKVLTLIEIVNCVIASQIFILVSIMTGEYYLLVFLLGTGGFLGYYALEYRTLHNKKYGIVIFNCVVRCVGVIFSIIFLIYESGGYSP